MMRRILSIGTTIVLAAGLGALPSSQAQTSQAQAAQTQAVSLATGTLSDTGNLAVRDLRECLSSNPESALDVYYLIDSSGSLFGADGTDPGIKRAEILQNSLVQLAKLSEKFSVQYAAAFFGDTFIQPSSWHPVTPQETGKALATEIRDQPTLGWTNWELAIDGAQNALATKKVETGGCQMLIWLTDGGINLGDDPRETASAINTLCGSQVHSLGDAPARGLGQFNELRQSNVSVFGTLLSVTSSLSQTDEANIPFMQPMVEGSADTTGIECGETPIPQGYSNGAYIQATDTTQLSRVFVGLSESIAGGMESDIDDNGRFQIDAGVAGFSIVSADGGEWSLTPPQSSTSIVSSDDTSDDLVLVTASAGALLVSWPTTGTAPESGEWTFKSGDGSHPKLFRFSGLRISLDELPRIVAQSPATITGMVARDGSEPLDLHNYEFTLTLSKRVAGTAEQTEIATIRPDMTSGVFSYEYTDEGPEGQYDIVASVTGLATTATRIALEGVSTTLPATIEVPGQFPTIGSQPIMTDLVGSSSVSTGSFTIVGPSNAGATGTACFPKPLLPADSPDADRNSTWTTSLAVSGTTIALSDCVEVNHGETVTVELAMSNSTPANSTVRAALSVALTPADGDALVQNVDAQAVSTQPVNQGILWSVLILLILLGLLIPLALLYLVNYLSAKVGYGAKLQRASFPVTVAPDGTITSRSGMNLRGSDVGTDNFKFQAPKADARIFTDSELGTLSASPPRNPFGTVGYAIAPAVGRLVFTLGKTGPQPPKQDFRTARKSTFSGHMSMLSALTVSEADQIAKGGREPVNGILVVYSTSPRAGQNGYSTRMAEVLSASKLRPAMANAREALKAEQADRTVKSGTAKTTATPTEPAPASATTSNPRVATVVADGRLDPAAPPPPKKRSAPSTEPPAAGRTRARPPRGSTPTGNTTPGRGSPPARTTRGGDDHPPPPPPPPRRN